MEKYFPQVEDFLIKLLLKRMISSLRSIQAFLVLESLSLLNFVTNKTSKNPSSKLTHFQSFLLPLMKLRLNLSNYDIGFRFCIH